MKNCKHKQIVDVFEKNKFESFQYAVLDYKKMGYAQCPICLKHLKCPQCLDQGWFLRPVPYTKSMEQSGGWRMEGPYQCNCEAGKNWVYDHDEDYGVKE